MFLARPSGCLRHGWRLRRRRLLTRSRWRVEERNNLKHRGPLSGLSSVFTLCSLWLLHFLQASDQFLRQILFGF